MSYFNLVCRKMDKTDAPSLLINAHTSSVADNSWQVGTLMTGNVETAMQSQGVTDRKC